MFWQYHINSYVLVICNSSICQKVFETFQPPTRSELLVSEKGVLHLFSFQVTEIFSQRCRNKEMLVFEIPFTIKKSGTFISLDNDPHLRETQYLIKLITSPIILIQPIYTCISQLVSLVCDVDIHVCINAINGDTYTLFLCLSLCFY